MSGSRNKPAAGSLAAYMQGRATRRDKATSERFDLPVFDALQVELRVVDHKAEFKIGDRNRKKVKDPGDRLLYTFADVIERATIGFFINGEQLAGLDNSWNGLCRQAYPETGELTVRQAIIRLLGPDGVSELYKDYADWRGDRGKEDADEDTEVLGSTR